MREHTDQQERPDPPPLLDLSLYSTPDLVRALVNELGIRHMKDTLILIVDRDYDGNVPGTYERIIGSANAVEGAIANTLRFVKAQNDRNRDRWNYTSRYRNEP